MADAALRRDSRNLTRHTRKPARYLCRGHTSPPRAGTAAPSHSPVSHGRATYPCIDSPAVREAVLRCPYVRRTATLTLESPRNIVAYTPHSCSMARDEMEEPTDTTPLSPRVSDISDGSRYMRENDFLESPRSPGSEASMWSEPRKKPNSRLRHAVGIALLLATVFLWTASNFLASVSLHIHFACGGHGGLML